MSALNERGVEYVEVRCVDLNPFEPLGINAEQIRFMDTFLLLCLLADSPADSVESRAILGRNQTRVVERGREPELQLESESGLIGLHDWATALLDACEPIAAALDQANGNAASQYLDSLGQQRDKLARPQLTPSAKVIAAMAMRGSFFKCTMDQAEQCKDTSQRRQSRTQPCGSWSKNLLHH